MFYKLYSFGLCNGCLISLGWHGSSDRILQGTVKQKLQPSAHAAVVFKMHYQELLAKDDEIQKLTTVIQALSTR